MNLFDFISLAIMIPVALVTWFYILCGLVLFLIGVIQEYGGD